ncbi:MAG: RusA family crossover junction endodeoxyribonuclease [Cyanobacteria bacterium P01_A01_bin.84]
MTDELLEELDRANRGEVPSPFGKAKFIVKGSPASIQASKDKRCKYINSIKNQFKPLSYVLTGDIILNITWLLPTKSRYETDAKADIDNCLKPIIDAFTGEDGLFIDDCQLRGLYICWQHIESEDEQVIFEFDFVESEFSSKSELAFVRLKGALCTPVNLNWPHVAKVIWASYLKGSQVSKCVLENLGVSYPAVAGFLASSRPFHVTRVKGFKVISLNEFVERKSVDEV